MAYQSVSSVYKGVEFRSRLEVRFASELDSLGIPWIYEPQRIGAEKYLIDFYLPNHRAWVEVKGVIAEIDRVQLPLIARSVAQQNEALFMYQSDDRAFLIKSTGWHPLSHAQLFRTLASTKIADPVAVQMSAEYYVPRVVNVTNSGRPPNEVKV